MNQDPSNVLLIHCHDLGQFLGCYGIPTVQSPHLDRLAAEGLLFERAFCTAPQCSPSRASLFTGRYPHSNGVMGLSQANFAWDLHADERHLAQELHDAGYATACVGVYHEARLTNPPDVQAIARRCSFDDVALGGRGQVVSRRAIERLERLAAGDAPFYLQVGYVEPHRLPSKDPDADHTDFISDYIEPDDALGVTVPPWLRDEPASRQETAELQGAVRYVDGCIGEVLQTVDRLGLRERTLVLFTADHGLGLPRAKGTLYDPGLGVPLIVRLPSRGWTGGRRLTELVSNVDVLPTILDLLGLPVREPVQGRSLRPQLDGEAYVPRDCVFGELTYHSYYDPRRCIRTERHKLIVNFSCTYSFMDSSSAWRPRTRPVVPARPWTAFHPTVELYDLVADPLEHHDLAEDPAYAEVRQELLARLHAWMRATGDPLLQGAVPSPMHHWAIQELMASLDAGKRS